MHDGVVFRHSADEFFLTAARPALSWFQELGSGLRVELEDVTEGYGMLAVQGPRSRAVLSALMPEAETLGYFDHVPVKVADTAVTLSRTGYTGDLGFELTVPEDRAIDVLDAVLEAGRGHGIRPFGEEALMTLRIEAGLALIDIEWHDARLAMSDADTVTPKELGFGWMLRGVRDGSRRFVGSEAIRRELAGRHVAVGDHRHRRRLGGLGPALPRQRPVPARSLRTRCPTSRCCITSRATTSATRSATARASSTRRSCSVTSASRGSARTSGRPAPSCGSSWPSTTTTPRSGSPRPRCRSSTLKEEEGMSTHEYDAIVVGGGHNGLTHAAYLAKAGLRTLVLEKNGDVGGAAITEELVPGFQFTTFSYALSLLRPEIIHELDLVQHGFLPLMMPSSFHPTGDGDYLLFGDDHQANLQEIRRHSPRDADAYERYHFDLDRVCQAVRPLFDNAPPNIFGKEPEDAVDTKWLLDHLGGVEQKVMHDVVRLLTGSASDWLDDYFEHEAIKGYHASSSIIGSKVGPMSPGSGLVLLFHKMGEHDGHLGSWAFHKGGNGGFTQVLNRAAQAYGAEVRLGSPVAEPDHPGGPGGRRRAGGRHRVPRTGRGLRAGPAAYVPRAVRPARAAARPGRQRRAG